MKILKFLLKPVKYFVILLTVGALIYFRAIIFHPNVNQYIDVAVSYVEDNIDFEIPQHVVEVEAVTVVEKIEDESLAADNNEVIALHSEVIASDVVTEDLPVNDSVEVEAPVLDVPDQEEDGLALIEGLAEKINIINKKVNM